MEPVGKVVVVTGGGKGSYEHRQRMWDVNVMSRLFAARAVVPQMLKQGGGYLVHAA
ncbi:MAG: hypothetical protein GY903_30605 [Fuerstiella sp.]|nr:hypothetical protein [Fuerstiella sp.]MCP4787546.1 hypothetical protein [Fuerstiella sp.]MCP4858843.1 hypothetical protein [Fuerstiella sp.]